MEKTSQYKTIREPSDETLFKDRGSKFLGYAFPVSTEEEVKERLGELWEQHNKATHICYAWQLGKRYELYRANDDGEPSNSAGMPIYGQLQSFNVTNAMVAVVRYYGGTKLGVGGLINAYRSSAQLALEASKIISCIITEKLELKFDYPLLNVVMRIIKELNLKIGNQEMHLDCTMTLLVAENNLDEIKERFDAIYGVEVTVIED